MISLDSVCYTYENTKTEALRDVSLRFPSKGLFYAIGESGSGKSTFIHILCGLLRDYKGLVRFDSHDISGLKESARADFFRQYVSVSLQEDLIDSSETVRGSILKPLRLENISEAERLNRLMSAAKMLGLTDLLKAETKTLSGGELKRVGLARALVKDAPVYLLDEPLNAIDGRRRSAITGLFRLLAKTHLLIVVTHSLEHIEATDHKLVFKDGYVAYESAADVSDNDIFKLPTDRRRKLNCIDYFSMSLSMLKAERHRVLSVIASAAVALIVFGLSVLIASGVRAGLSNSLKGFMGENSMLVERRQNDIMASEYAPASYGLARRIAARYPEASGIGAYYELNFENMFANGNMVYFARGSRRLILNSLSGRSFAEFTYISELPECESRFADTLDKDEIALGLNYKDYASLIRFMDAGDAEGLDAQLRQNPAIIYIELEAGSISYRFEWSFFVRHIFSSDRTHIISDNPLFGEYFVEELMRFSASYVRKDIYETPWTVYKSYFIFVPESKKRAMLDKIASDSELSDLRLMPLNDMQPFFYRKENGLTHGRLAILKAYKKDVCTADINAIVNEYSRFLYSYSYSDGFYYYSDQGFYSGFLKPVYVASDKSVLNRIADYNYEAMFDLNGFQGSTIICDDKVVAGNISSSDADESLVFRSYISPPALIRGYIPDSYNQIIISSALAEAVFGERDPVINSSLHIMCLAETVFRGSGYKNIFTEGSLLVTGIVEDDSLALYQQPLFLKSLGQDQLNLPFESFENDKALLFFDEKADPVSLAADLAARYPEYKFSLPVMEINLSIDFAIDSIQKGLGIFALFSGLIAIVLFSMVMISFISDNRVRAGIMIILGFYKREIRQVFFTLCLMLSLASFVSSGASLILISIGMKGKIADLIGADFTSFIPKVLFCEWLICLAMSALTIILSFVFMFWRGRETMSSLKEHKIAKH